MDTTLSYDEIPQPFCISLYLFVETAVEKNSRFQNFRFKKPRRTRLHHEEIDVRSPSGFTCQPDVQKR